MIRERTAKDRQAEEDRHAASKARSHKVAVRPFWSGTIAFGLISIPVQLFPATRRTSSSLRMLAGDGTPLQRRYYCPADDRLVEPEEIVRGYELEDGEFVFVEDDELEAIEPRKSREIDLRQFVDLSRLPPLRFERAYFLTPSGDSNKAYRLLAEVMEQTERAGIATFVMRNKEYLVAILSEGGILRAATLRFEEEIRDPGTIGLPEPPKVTARAVSEIEKAIRSHESDELDLDELEDEYSAELRQLAERKRAEGTDLVEAGERRADEAEGDGVPEEGEDEVEVEEIDLLETIRLNLTGGNGSSPSSTS